MTVGLKSLTRLTAVGLLAVLAASGLPLAAVAAEKTEEKVERETIKAQATMWREADESENPSDLMIQTSFPDKLWWEQFRDPFLARCIQQAVNANLNLAAAHARIDEARALARQSLGREFPQVTLGGTFSRARNSTTIFPGGGNVSNRGGAGFLGGGGGAFALGQYIHFYSVPLTASYEADIWQKNRDITRAANKQATATERDFEAAHVIVATDVANAYLNLLAADRMIALRQQIIDTAEADLAHAQRLFEAGVTGEENVVLRQGRLTDFKALLQQHYRQQALALNQLAVLMGQTPYQVAHLERAQWDQYVIPDVVPAGIPSELLTRRPDILAAEERLAASGFLVRVARKELLPSINLTGQFGFATANIGDLSTWDSYIASIAGSMAQSIFTGGQKRANIKVQQARYEQQLLAYRDTILQSFREVDDSLASLKASRNAYLAYEDSMTSLERRVTLQKNQLAAGAIAEAELNPVQLEVLQAQEGLARTKLQALTDVLSLYKALGGGY